MTMGDLMNKLSLNSRLAATAFVLGLVALFAGSPYHGADATVNTKELALVMATDADQVTATTLADWLVQGRADFRIVDVRTAPAFAEYHLPSAENIPVTGLNRTSLQHNEKIVVYADDGARAAQAWLLLRAKGYQGAVLLRGGLEAWKDSVLFPRIPENPTPAQSEAFAKAREVSTFFGGAPQSGAGDAGAVRQVAMPTLTMPSANVAGAPKKKKKEGC